MIVKLIRNNGEIYYNGVKLHINKQATKGIGHEYVDLDQVKDSNLAEYQHHIRLAVLVEGENEIELKPRKNISIEKYSLTEEEKAKIAEYQSKIDAIIEAAKARQPKKAKRVEDMSIAELEAYIAAKKLELGK